MSASNRPLRVAFIHPDLGIGGAERLVVDAAVGLQKLGHSVDIYTSHHDPNHCFEETRDGTLNVQYVVPPLPRSVAGKFHILFAHLRQLHLTLKLLRGTKHYDVFFVDQLSTCIPFLRGFGGTRVVFYCHFPDKLLASGAFVEGDMVFKRQSLIKRLYRLPMDWLEEVTTRQADIILANSKFTARVFKRYFPSIYHDPTIVYPGINLDTYEADYDDTDPNVRSVVSDRPTLISLNRFEGKKNIILALKAFAKFKARGSHPSLRLVLAGGYDPRLEDNIRVVDSIQTVAKSLGLSYTITSPSPLPPTIPASPFISEPDVLVLLNFTTAQRTALLRSPSTLALLYTPENEHFGIVPVEAMSCGVPVLACDSGGPLESITQSEPRTGWLRRPDPAVWADALEEILALSPGERSIIAETAKRRAKELFGMEALAKGIEKALIEAVGMGKVSSDEVWGVWWKVAVMLLGPPNGVRRRDQVGSPALTNGRLLITIISPYFTREWHFHIYFHQKNTQEKEAALKLRDAVLRLRRDGAFVAVPLFRVNVDPIGPHPVGSYEIWAPSETFSSVFSYLALYRGNLRDHEIRNAWLGPPFPLDLSTLPLRSEERPLQYPSLKLGYSAVSSGLTVDQRLKLGEKIEGILRGDKQAAPAPPRD
ncbi:hypothetical protein NMY22_g10411 [Coprinellus aureogranulatus]|nr:hypothetical protein NMY22_g10411 [Coprinellus aureogranulatus]